MPRMRIQKLLSESGVASRRAIEEMIVEGRITVNGELVLKIPCFVDPDVDEIRVDERNVRKRAAKKVYYLLNKPKGVVCTQRDIKNRTLATDLVPSDERLYCVGRLDVESSGLILLTNDGELTQYLTHPRYGVEKTYLVEMDGQITGEEMEILKRGFWMDGRRVQGAAVKMIDRSTTRCTIEIRVKEGPNREVRRILAKFGHKVRRLQRTAIGPVMGRGVKVGRFRELSPDEVQLLSQCGEQR